jgi:hypothetical protein
VLADAKQRTREGAWEPAPEPTTFQFSTHRDGVGTLTPLLYVFMEGGGYGTLGGVPLEGKQQKDFTDRWMLRGNRMSDPKCSAVVPAPEEVNGEHTLRERLEQLASAVQLSLIPRLPVKQRTYSGAPYG